MNETRQRVDALAELHAWQPDELAGFQVGDAVMVGNLGRCVVVELLPPSLLLVKTAAGGQAKVGWRACNKACPTRC